MWESIEQSIFAATGVRTGLRGGEAIGGGCINAAMRLQGDTQGYFVKLNQPPLVSMFEAEAAGLAELHQTGAIRVPEPIAFGADHKHSWLVLEYIDFGTPDGDTAALGEQLAALHRVRGKNFGWERDNTIGSTPQINTPDSDWARFFACHRLGYQLELAESRGLNHRTIESGQRLAENTGAFFTGYQPQPSLLHGDLWGGNWAVDTSGQPVIFDPAVYYGDRETDIAMTELFGGFGSAFYSAYQAAWPLDPGYSVRRNLYNLYHVLNHYNLFGGGYADQSDRLIGQLLAELA